MGNRDQRGRWLKAAIAAVMLLPVAAFAGPCREDTVHLKGDWGQARFTVEVADDNAERSKGLMHRESMAQSAGMLFVYERPQVARFWMKNTLIPLDIIFMDDTGTVKRVHPNAEPLSERLIPGGRDIKYVLEVNGGVAAQFGIGEGDVLRHPAIANDRAAWACEAQ